MKDYLGKTVIFAVAQKPFENIGPNGIRKLFATLAPICTKAGDAITDVDFPNNGLAWWMVTGAGSRIAVPGALVRAPIETATKYVEDDPSSTYYQARHDQIGEIDINDLVELFALDDDVISQRGGLLGKEALVHLNRPPGHNAFVLWRENVYGPFRTSIVSAGAEYGVAFALIQGRAPRRIPREALPAVGTQGRLRRELRVSTTAQRREKSDAITCVYDVVCGTALRDILLAGQPVEIERDVDIVRRVSKRLLSDREYRAFKEFVTKVGERAVANDTVTPNEQEVLKKVRDLHEADRHAIDELAKALVDSDVLAGRITQALEDAKKDYIEKHAAALQAQIRADVEALSDEREQLNREVAELRNGRSQAHQDMESGIARLRGELDAEAERKRRDLDEELRRRRVEQEAISHKFEALHRRFATERDAVVTELLG